MEPLPVQSFETVHLFLIGLLNSMSDGFIQNVEVDVRKCFEFDAIACHACLSYSVPEILGKVFFVLKPMIYTEMPEVLPLMPI